MSSMHSAVLANSSLTSMPLWPYFWNANGDPKPAPVLRSVRSDSVAGSDLPAYFESAGLGSNVSTCDGPPFMNRWITRFARPGNCGSRALSGFSPRAGPAEGEGAGDAASRPESARRLPSASAPKPIPARQSASRRVTRASSGRGAWCDIVSGLPQSTNTNSLVNKSTWAYSSQGESKGDAEAAGVATACRRVNATPSARSWGSGARPKSAW